MIEFDRALGKSGFIFRPTISGIALGRICSRRIRQIPAIARPFCNLGRKRAGISRCIACASTRKLARMRRRITPWMTGSLINSLNFDSLFQLTSRFRQERFDVRDAARQNAGHPLDAFRRDHHVVFDAHADAFILFERGPYGSDEFFVIRSLR